ncbi:hypothetical protein Tco_0013984 [Tanacetum coccineum]
MSVVAAANPYFFRRDVEKATRLIRCLTFSTPFNYLGVKPGDDMSKIKSWDEVTSKISSHLSKWKLNTIYIGGRLTLLKMVLISIPLYHMSIFKVPIGVLNKLESIHRKFFNGVDGTVGNGEDTKFWEDPWLNKAALKVYFPRVYALETQKDISEVDKMIDTTLAISF